LTQTIASLRDKLIGDAKLSDQKLYLQLGDSVLSLASNSAPLLDELATYFHHIVRAPCTADIAITAIDGTAPDLGIHFTDWRRESGKDSKKDSYYDIPNARVLRKVRTGMIFLQGWDFGIAAGPCFSHHNQLINFINSQYMNRLQRQGWLICHAAGLSIDGQGLALAGFSGGGKSTLMLHLMNDKQARYISNDRLFIRNQDHLAYAAGIPKLPRVNPGTILNNPLLMGLIDEAEQAHLRGMPTHKLWDLEKKYDVPVEKLYGEGSIEPQARLSGVVILNWRHESKKPTHLEIIDPFERKDLLPAIMKSPGPFYQDSAGTFLTATTPPPPERYLSILKNVTVYELSGKIDFNNAVELIRRRLKA
jgi:HprK-related kinase B